MALNSKQYVYTDLSLKDCLTLTIGGTDYQVTQFACGYAVNEIPTAVCMLALGRNARTRRPAAVHTNGDQFQMQKATVTFRPNLEYDPSTRWPNNSQVIFDGYFTGFAYRKINGKVYAVANLVHWLAALGMSCTLTKNGHVANPTALNAAAVLTSLTTTIKVPPIYISQLVMSQTISTMIAQDVWGAIKKLFTTLALVPALPPGAGVQGCGGNGDITVNDMALNALSRIEGDGMTDPDLADYNVKYKWGVPLKLDNLGSQTVSDRVADSIGASTIESWAHATFWDKLVGEFCPAFGMAVVPLASSAVVIADTPGYSGDFWRELEPDEYDTLDMNAQLFRPLRAVGVLTTYGSMTLAGVETVPSAANMQAVGGCWVEDSVAPGDGVTQYINAPRWLTNLNYNADSAGQTTGGKDNKPTKNACSDDVTPVPANTGGTFNELFKRYAHAYFANAMLRGRQGTVSGKLRFDIAPGSIVKINPSYEAHMQGVDHLAYTLFGCVNRVSITINAEASMAGTALTLSHVRTEDENGESRTSVPSHPLFGGSIHGNGKHGCPLVDAYEFPPSPAGDFPLPGGGGGGVNV